MNADLDLNVDPSADSDSRGVRLVRGSSAIEFCWRGVKSALVVVRARLLHR